MNFQLSVLDKDGNLLNVAAIPVGSKLIALTDALTDNITALNLLAGNDYTITIPTDINAPTSTFTITSPDDVAINIVATPGNSYTFTPAADITQLDFSVLSTATETYDQTISITGENIEVIINGVTTTGANIVNQVIADDSTFDIEVISAGYYTYTNTVRVYDYDVEVEIKLIQVITDIEDPDYRFPYPYFFYILEPCSFNIHIYNAQSLPFGGLSYEVNGEQIASGTLNTIFNTCEPDVVTITQRLIIREIPNCGGTSNILYNETYTIEGITTTEYRPDLTLDRALNCCELLNTEITISPREILLYNEGIHSCDITTVPTSLQYIITDSSGTETILATYSGTDVDTLPLVDLGFTYTPTELGTYSLQVVLTNCCTTTITTHTFDVCYSWLVTNSDCNIIKITNLSTSSPISFFIKELSDVNTFTPVVINEVEQTDVILGAGSTQEIDLQVDNLYTVTIVDKDSSTEDKEYVFVLDCNIKECKKRLLREFLCGVDECDDATRFDNMVKLAEFKTLEEVIYQKWDIWKQQQSIYNTLSINDIMEDVIGLSKAIQVINKLCSTCGITSSCSTDKRYTCNYTITNWNAYLVPIRSARIIVPNNGTDCGCN